MLVWRDVLIAVLVVMGGFVVLSLAFPVKSVEECSGYCPRSGNITACDCSVRQAEPFPFFYLVRLAVPITVGLSFYAYRNRPSIRALMLLFLISCFAWVASYALFFFGAMYLGISGK